MFSAAALRPRLLSLCGHTPFLRWYSCRIFLIVILAFTSSASAAEQAGSIRGMVYDKDFEVPLAAANIQIAETQQNVFTSEEGNYSFSRIQPGTYTLIFSKAGYTRQVKANVVVSAGTMTEVDAWLSGEFTEMEEFLVQDVQIGAGTEEALLNLRMESPALIDSIGSDMMSQAGVSDAASALRLVAGATVQEGKYAVVRGLPDRYVVSLMNGVRLPTADPDKRAVQLDQFPAAVIESIQVSKTFTPDQQGDASGGAVNIILKGIPDSTVFSVSGQYGWNSNVKDAGSDFLSYDDGGLNCWGKDDSRNPQPPVTIWDGAVGVSRQDALTDYKWQIAAGTRRDFEDFSVGGFGTFYYERDSSYFDDGIDDKFWAEEAPPGTQRKLVPQYSRGAPAGAEEGFFTSLFDVTQGTQSVNWGTLGTFGMETEGHSLSLLYLYTHDAEDEATLAENTRGKATLGQYWPENYDPEQFANYDPYNPDHIGNSNDYISASPYRRNETQQYTERTTDTLQFSGRHELPIPEFRVTDYFNFLTPQLDWTYAISSSSLYQPDKTLFATQWKPGPIPELHAHGPYLSADTANLGFVQRLWKDISEDSDQYFANLKLPFEQWSGDPGYLKFGIFHDEVDREYDQDSFSNFGFAGNYLGPWEDFWSAAWDELGFQDYKFIQPAEVDVDYEGHQEISAWYYMIDMPLCSWFNIIGGARYEDTELSITNFPESKVEWYPFPPDPIPLRPGDADVAFEQRDVLPAIGFEFKPLDEFTLRGNYAETVARQTFKELTPIAQQEYLGADVFIGNPDLRMSALKNYDLRFDYTPYVGALVSVSYFSKDIADPIEYVQKAGNGFDFTTPENYPEGTLSGWEFETRQHLGHFNDALDGLTVGANATFIDSEVTISDYEVDALRDIGVSMEKRDMSWAPEHLYNLFFTYDVEDTGTQLGLFYTIRGDTLIAGAGEVNGRFAPSVYETEYGTLNFSLSQRLGDIWKLKFQAKNLLNPDIQTVYRDQGRDTVKTSYTKGIDLSVSLSAQF